MDRMAAGLSRATSSIGKVEYFEVYVKFTVSNGLPVWGDIHRGGSAETGKELDRHLEKLEGRPDPIVILNLLGRDGWHLVSCQDVVYGDTEYRHMVLTK